MNEKKVQPNESSLALTSRPVSGLGISRRADVRPPTNSRQARRLAQEALMRQWEIEQKARRSARAIEVMGAVATHAQRTIDLAQQEMGDRFYKGERHEPMNQFIGEFTSKCLTWLEAGTMAVLDSLPRRIAEDL